MTVSYGVEDLSDEGLSAISEGARALRRAKADVEAAEGALKLAQARVFQIETVELPSAMRALGLEQFKLDTGEVITVRDEVNAGITEANREAAFAWLRNSGNDSLIKRTVTVAFGKGDDALATKMLAAIEKIAPDLECQDKAAVNPQTLKAFVREKIELEKPDPETGAVAVQGKDLLPRDVFGVFILNRAVVKTAKQ